MAKPLSLSVAKRLSKAAYRMNTADPNLVIKPLLERIHRSVGHVGKAPRAVRVREWKERMKAAIAAEDYEEAARLRDLIRGADK